MPMFKHPAFAKLTPKIDRADKELRQIENYWANHREEALAGEWAPVSAISLGIHNVYNGIEEVLLSLAKDIDGLVPGGPTAHQDILDQMSAAIADIRPAVLDGELYEALTELKAFRHLVRHRYGFDLKPDRVEENLDRTRRSFPVFVGAVIALEEELTREIDTGSARTGGEADSRS